MSEFSELEKIVEVFHKPLRLHEGDAKTIICRFAYLKQKLGTKTFPDIKLLLTSIYCYTRTPRYGRKILGAYKFCSLCREFGYTINHRDLWRYQKLYFEHGYYTPIINSQSYFEAAWHDLSRDLLLPETAKDMVSFLLKEMHESKRSSRSPSIVVGTAIYLIGKKIGKYLTQAEIASYFGISEVGIRNAVKDFESVAKIAQFLEE